MNGTDLIIQLCLSCPLCSNKEQVGDSPSRWFYLISGPYFCSSHIYRPIWHSDRLIIAYLKGTSNSMSLNWMDFCNSVKLWAMPWRATQDWQVMVESSDKMWSTGRGNGKLLQYFCLQNPMNSMKRQKDMTPEDEPPGQKVSHVLPEKNRGQLVTAPERMKRIVQTGNDTQLWMCLVVKVKLNAVKNNIA